MTQGTLIKELSPTTTSQASQKMLWEKPVAATGSSYLRKV